MRYGRAFALSATFGAVVLSALAFYGDAPRLWETAISYPLPLLVPVLLLTAVNYTVRWVKWSYYLTLVGASGVRTGDSVLIFLSGFAMGLTPGKVGEVVKPYLLRERYGVPVIQTTPILFAERLTDGIALIGLAAAGLVVYGTGLAAMGVILVVALLAVLALSSPRFVRGIVALAERLPVAGKRLDALHALLLSASTLLGWRAFGFAVGLGVISWGCEALAFFLVLAGLSVPATPLLLLQSTFALASATIFGSASLMPGGLGVAEASLTGFLQLVVGLSRTHAAYGTLLIRLCTLWFGVGLGSLALLSLSLRRASQHSVARTGSRPVAEPFQRG